MISEGGDGERRERENKEDTTLINVVGVETRAVCRRRMRGMYEESQAMWESDIIDRATTAIKTHR